MANPWLHHNDARTINAIQKVERIINADLAALKSDGYFRMTFGPPDPDKSGYFFKRSDAATGTLFKFSMRSGNIEAPPEEVPFQLADIGVTQEQWMGFVEKIDAERRIRLCGLDYKYPWLIHAALCVPSARAGNAALLLSAHMCCACL